MCTAGLVGNGEAQMTKPVTCDQCGKRFGPAVKVEHLPDGGEQWWFKCLHCGHRYEVATITAKGVQLRTELDALKRRGPAQNQPKFRWLADVQELQEAMAAEVSKP